MAAAADADQRNELKTLPAAGLLVWAGPSRLHDSEAVPSELFLIQAPGLQERGRPTRASDDPGQGTIRLDDLGR